MAIEGVNDLKNNDETQSGESSEATQDTSAAPPMDINPPQTTSPDVVVVDNVADPNADASADDAKVQQTDNAPTAADGSQDGVDQNPVSENVVPVEESNANPSA